MPTRQTPTALRERPTPLGIRIGTLATVAALVMAWPSAAPPSDTVRRSAASDALTADETNEVVIGVPPWHGLTFAADGLTRMGPTSSGHAPPPAPPVTEGVGVAGIPEIAYAAYVAAETSLAVERPSCHLDWQLVAAIGRVESNHGRFAGAWLRVDGTSVPAIRGIALDGRPGVAVITDTDDGALDGDVVHDRAVGPMQFIPATWRAVFPDGNPDNLFDAAFAAGRYLCASGGDLRDLNQRAAAVFRYNHSAQYVRLVLRVADQYRAGAVPLPTTSVDLTALTAASAQRNPSASTTSVVAAPMPANAAAPTGSFSSTSSAGTTAPGTTAPATTTTTAPPTTTVPPATTSPTPTTPPSTDTPPSAEPPADCGLLGVVVGLLTGGC